METKNNALALPSPYDVVEWLAVAVICFALGVFVSSSAAEKGIAAARKDAIFCGACDKPETQVLQKVAARPDRYIVLRRTEPVSGMLAVYDQPEDTRFGFGVMFVVRASSLPARTQIATCKDGSMPHWISGGMSMMCDDGRLFEPVDEQLPRNAPHRP